MQESSVSSRLPAKAPTEDKPMSRSRTWVQSWRSFWRLQRSYLSLTLLMLFAVGIMTGLLWLFALWIFPPGVPDALTTDFQWQLWLACALLAVLLTATFVSALQINARHVRQATAALARLAKGDLAARTDLEVSAGEIGQLNRAVNRLGERMERHSLQLMREHERFDAVLNAMSDGVLLLDRRGAVTLINPAACRLLQNDPEHSLRQSFVQVVRDYRIADVWQQSAQRQVERSATVEVSPGYFLRVSVTPFLDGSTNGFLVLIQDQSNAHRLEAVRRDLVSNISHELRTPLASIKALVDTLRDGAMSDPPAAERFLERMEVEVDSMTQMIQELLELADRVGSGAAAPLSDCAGHP
ncbi:MAG: PAS domain-containing protein [Anaerolineales bacterium]|nr:PAS domain-containing protein [Anaerolineales bacterium]